MSSPPGDPPVVAGLPEPARDGRTSVEKALLQRRSVREYRNQPLTLAEISQLVWAAAGITDRAGYRTAPSAGALYPLEVYVVAGNVNGLAAGVYRYSPRGHELVRIAEGDRRRELAAVALGQEMIRHAAADLVFTAVYRRTTSKYGERGMRYVHMEAGHAAENVSLQAVPLRLGTVMVGAFDDARVRGVLNLPGEEAPLYIIPIGRI